LNESFQTNSATLTAKPLIQPFHEFGRTDIAIVGGKGANLGEMIRAGLPVPDGFILPTSAYRDFLDANGLKEKIAILLTGLSAEDAPQLEMASANIRAAFTAGKLSSDLETSIREAYAKFGSKPVAVRSSATTEDLPDLSFAGQQDTYLNIIGEQALLKAVVDCWSSLWTARAIGYRMRNGISNEGVALAVVVQMMVASDTSGVLFTANPLTGLLSETVIDATFGLGEALVSGQVEPDHFVVNSLTGEVVSSILGTKAVSTRSKPGGGVETTAEAGETRQTLTKNELEQLVALGQKVQSEYGAPQDIEWAVSQGKLYLLQARPITSLFPVPEVSFDPLTIWVSFADVQGLSGPMTPLGQDTLRTVVAGAGRMFHAETTIEKVRLFASAGERIWVRISDLLRNPLGYKVAPGAFGFLEPSIGLILRELLTDPHLGAGQGKLKLKTLARLLYFFGPVFIRFIGNMLWPAQARTKFDALIDHSLATKQIKPGADRFERLANTVAFMRSRISDVFAFMLPRFIPLFGPSMAAFTLLNRMFPDDRVLVLEVTRGLPNNVTTEMDLALWKTALAIRADAASVVLFQGAEAGILAQKYLAGALPTAAQQAIEQFMERYGMHGVGEIDFGQVRWREDPTPVMHTLQSYLYIEGSSAPDEVFARGEAESTAAIEKLVGKASKLPHGWLKKKQVRMAARRIRLLMGGRESPKFFAVRTIGIARKAMLAVGQEFVQAGTLERADDLVYLRLVELDALAKQEQRDWKVLVAERRATYQRETRRRQAPRVLVSDGRAFYEGFGAETDTSNAISGSPVSPGVVEGVVHVVLDPRGTQLTPGEILVCVGTDPAWTPLFLTAGGLITEVGGVLTHGSVVAREYGIPAVVGVHEATRRLKSGQRIRLDGTSGIILLLE
jgi:rifampicin phosphotransferase